MGAHGGLHCQIKPWLNDARLIGKIKERNRLYALKLKNSNVMTPGSLADLRRLTNEVNHLRRDLKRSFFAKRLDEAGKNSKAAWRILHQFIGKPCGGGDDPCRTFVHGGATITGDSRIAESLCDFFTKVGPDLAGKVKTPATGSFRDYLGPPSPSSAFFAPTTPGEMEFICQGLDASKGPGHDDISPAAVRHVSSELSGPLSRLVNACLEVGYFPDFLKVARVSPIFKSGDPAGFGNYRPISVLPVFSKIFERVVQERLLSFLKQQGSILDGQYGFRRGHSTYMAILDMVERIRQAWEDDEHCLGVFIDFSKAFDTVDHSILVSKLESLGIRGLPLELLRSYLSNRKQYVVFRGVESLQQDICVGIPQGSILGPLLFLLYINDLSRASTYFRYILFADDTNLFASGKDRRALYMGVNSELGKLSDWFAHSRLTLNYSKTEFIEFCKPTNGSSSSLDLKLDGSLIKEVNDSKFLGVHIDKNISWRVHIGKIIAKISQTVGIIGRARSFMNGPQLLCLYNTMVLPHLQYCLINWGNFKGDRNLGLRDRILALQKRLVRIICGTHRISHADPLFAQLGALKIDDLYTQSVRIISFKASRNQLPGGMTRFFDKVSHRYNTRGARSNLFVNRSDCRSIKSIAPSIWNASPLEMRQSPSIASFKGRSKVDLLSPYSTFVCNVRGCCSCAVSV